MGGTFMSMPEDYRQKFVAGLHNALSGFTGEDIDEAIKCVVLLSHLRDTDASIGTQSRARPSVWVSRLRRGQITASSRI